MNKIIKDFLNEANINDVITVIDEWAITIKEIKTYIEIEKNKDLAKKRKNNIRNKFKMKWFFKNLVSNK
jgi:hypothetical protein